MNDIKDNVVFVNCIVNWNTILGKKQNQFIVDDMHFGHGNGMDI